MSGEGKVVCVTGGSGYMASWLIKFLLQRAYTVKATVRNPNDPLHLREQRKGFTCSKLIYWKKDLLMLQLMVVKLFSTQLPPVSLQANADPQAELVDPAVKGTLNVLRSCAKAPSVKRVIITSSFASLPYNGKTLAPDVVVDETWFSDPAVCAERKIRGTRVVSSEYCFRTCRVSSESTRVLQVQSSEGCQKGTGRMYRVM